MASEPTADVKNPESAPPSVIADFSLAALRFVVSAWVGAAILFVITSVAEQTSPNFVARTRDQLATIRFPLYYMFGFAVHGASLLAATLLRLFAQKSLSGRATLLLVLVCLSSGLIWYDYTNIYQPLQAVIDPPGQPRTPEFDRLHHLSTYLNSTHIFIMLLVASIAVLPRRTNVQ